LSESTPKNVQSDPGRENISSALHPDSPFTDLDAIVLSIEWEITVDIMTKFLAEIEKLKLLLKNDKNLYPFLQLHGSVGRYIKGKKVSAHPDSIKLLHSVHGGIVKILTTPEMTTNQKKAILTGEIRKFKELKRKILKTQNPAPKDKMAKRVQPRETAVVAPLPEPVAAAVEEIKKFIREEFSALRKELRSLKNGNQ